MLERKTIVSTQLLKILKKSRTPLSAEQIFTLLKDKEITPNKTTIYRILDKLKKSHSLLEISIRNGKKYYELNEKKHHHHHFICNNCEHVYCLDSCLIDVHKINLEKLIPNKNFEILSHEFNIYGNCSACLEKK